MPLESQKKELLLGLNSFDKPAEVIGKNAWIKLITHLLFLKKGTYPSNPLIGIGIQQYEFSFMDDTITLLQSEILEQARIYLPDVPLDSVVVDSTEVEGKKILLIIITFIDDGNIDTAVVATAVSQNIIDFEVSM